MALLYLWFSSFHLQIKRVNPEKVCYLEYDKLYVDHKIYVWNETLGQVIEHAEAERYGYGGINDFMMSRPGKITLWQFFLSINFKH